MSSTRDTNVSVAVDDLEKSKLEALAGAYDSSQAGVFRHWIDEQYHEMFGDIHPHALERSDVDVESLIHGEIEPEEVDDDLKLSGDRPAQIPAADGGVSAPMQPESYSPTHTASDLSTAGPELTWSELKESIKRHWCPDLEIHPDRVADRETLKSNLAVSSKVITAILRAHGDIVTESNIESAILRYTGHQIRRADVDSGMEYKQEQYKPLILEHFIPHPDPRVDEYYTSERAARELLPELVESTIESLLEGSEIVLDPKLHARRSGVNPKEDPRQWLDGVATVRAELGILHAVRERETLREIVTDADDTVFEELPTLLVAVAKAFTPVLEDYRTLVTPHARYLVSENILEIDDEDMLEVEDYSGQKVVTVNPDRPAMPIMEWEQSRGKPLSLPARYEDVAERL